MNATTQLQLAFEPLLTRTKRRAERLKQLAAQPPSDTRDKSIAAEKREIDLVRQVATATSQLVESLAQDATTATEQRQQVLDRVQEVADNATHYETLFMKTVDLVPDPPDEQVPALVFRCYQSIVRMGHLKDGSYAQRYPNPFPLLPVYEFTR